jgi:hypothetical protein
MVLCGSLPEAFRLSFLERRAVGQAQLELFGSRAAEELGLATPSEFSAKEKDESPGR